MRASRRGDHRQRLHTLSRVGGRRHHASTVNTTLNGIWTQRRAQQSYIADNVVNGPSTWDLASLGADRMNAGEGIVVTGPGHVIMNNRVKGFRDCISFIEDDGAVEQISIDVLNNDIEIGADDAIEADFCFHNCRIMRNRISNSFVAMSSQPGLGGPTYFIRNVRLQRHSLGLQAPAQQRRRRRSPQHRGQERRRLRPPNRRRLSRRERSHAASERQRRAKWAGRGPRRPRGRRSPARVRPSMKRDSRRVHLGAFCWFEGPPRTVGCAEVRHRL